MAIIKRVEFVSTKSTGLFTPCHVDRDKSMNEAKIIDSFIYVQTRLSSELVCRYISLTI